MAYSTLSTVHSLMIHHGCFHEVLLHYGRGQPVIKKEDVGAICQTRVSGHLPLPTKGGGEETAEVFRGGSRWSS